MKKKEQPLVSVSLICYNQKNYIKQAIDSVLMQKTNFDYEIVLSDDNSTDGTNLICEEYAQRYPDKIRLIKHDHNIGGVRNYLENYKLCNGKYVSYLEGDDFFLDPNKLQKQVDFLENNPDYVICCSHVEIVDENGKFKGQLFDDVLDTYTIEKLCEADVISTPTCMVRNHLIKDIPKWLYEFNGCDWTFDIINAEYGKIKYMNERLAAYRVHSNGSWSKLSVKQQSKEFINLATKVDKYLDYKYHESFSKAIEFNKKQYYSLSPKNSALNYIKKNPLFLFKPIFYKKAIKYIFKRVWNVAKKEIPEYALIKKMNERIDSLEFKIMDTKIQDVDLVILDDMYPYVLSGFRNSEFNSYLDYFKDSIALTTGESMNVFENEQKTVRDIIKADFVKNPSHIRRIQILDDNDTIRAKAAIICFLSLTYKFLPFLERNNIPFVFTLYPGGGFAVNDTQSDDKLRRIFSSPCFRKVIVTQKYTYDYLIKHNFCSKNDIELIYGSVILDNENSFCLGEKQYYNFDKSTLDVCFVAQKYMPTGSDKGYDIFIEAAKVLAQKYDNIMFHVVGGFSKNDIDVTSISDKIRFYGVQEFDWFKEFYRDKDIVVAPNVPFKLGPGAFDGFPVTCALDAMKNGVAAICSDELNCNVYYENNKDIVLIKPNKEEIIEKIQYYYDNPQKLKNLGISGKKTTEDVYSYESQILSRIKIIEKVINENKKN